MARITSARTLTLLREGLGSKALERRGRLCLVLVSRICCSGGGDRRRNGRAALSGSHRRGSALAARCGGRVASRARDGRVVELAQLRFDQTLELLAVLALERAELVDAVLEQAALLVEGADLGALLGLGLRDDARRRGVTLGDECIPLLETFLDVLLVQTASQLQQVVGAVGVVVRVDRCCRSGLRCCRETLLELLVLLLETVELGGVDRRCSGNGLRRCAAGCLRATALQLGDPGL